VSKISLHKAFVEHARSELAKANTFYASKLLELKFEFLQLLFVQLELGLVCATCVFSLVCSSLTREHRVSRWSATLSSCTTASTQARPYLSWHCSAATLESMSAWKRARTKTRRKHTPATPVPSPCWALNSCSTQRGLASVHQRLFLKAVPLRILGTAQPVPALVVSLKLGCWALSGLTEQTTMRHQTTPPFRLAQLGHQRSVAMNVTPLIIASHSK
jgi:hypothetical protein